MNRGPVRAGTSSEDRRHVEPNGTAGKRDRRQVGERVAGGGEAKASRGEKVGSATESARSPLGDGEERTESRQPERNAEVSYKTRRAKRMKRRNEKRKRTAEARIDALLRARKAHGLTGDRA